MARAAKKKSKRKSASKANRGGGGPSLSPEQVRRITTALGIAGLGAAGAFGVFWGASALEVRAASFVSSETGAAGVREIRIAWPMLASAGSVEAAGGEPATWLHPEFRRRIESAAREAAGAEPGPFNPAQLRAIGRAMRASGWFASDPVVRRGDGGSIEVIGRWRSPAAVVRHRGRDYLIASDTGRLPEVYPENGSGLPVILGVREPAPVRVPEDGGALVADYGTMWGGAGVGRAVSLLELLGAEPFFDQIAAVDTADGRAPGGLTIITTGQNRVVWGSAPVDGFRPGEVETAVKLERLRTLHARLGRIDAGRSVIEIFPDQPLEIDPPREGG